MKPLLLFLLINVTAIVALAFYGLQGGIAINQLPVVALLSLGVLNGAAILGIRLRRKRGK
jgi:hypothetical protein